MHPYAFWMHIKMHSECTKKTLKVHPNCTQNAPQMHQKSTWIARQMHPRCTPDAPQMHVHTKWVHFQMHPKCTWVHSRCNWSLHLQCILFTPKMHACQTGCILGAHLIRAFWNVGNFQLRFREKYRDLNICAKTIIFGILTLDTLFLKHCAKFS